MSNNGFIPLFTTAILMVAAGCGEAAAAGKTVMMSPNRDALGTPTVSVPSSQLHYCSPQRFVGEAEFYTMDPHDIPNSMPWDLYTKATRNWMHIVASQLGPKFADTNNAVDVDIEDTYDQTAHVWRYQWSGRPCEP